MKKIIGILISLILGAFIGIFGVFNSIFSDGSINERLITISVILLIYVVISFIFGLTVPAFSWEWGIFVGSGGLLLLVLYSFKEFNIYYFGYMILIITFSCASSYLGNKIKRSINL